MTGSSHSMELSLEQELIRDLNQARPTYQALANIDLVDRIELVREGLPAQTLLSLARNMGVSRETLFQWAGIAAATAKRRISREVRLNLEESERVLSLLSMVAQADRIVTESGDPTDFDAGRWLAQWLTQPNRSLAGKVPADYLDTIEGRELLRNRIGQMQSGAYS